jgi:hypothetical protein
MDLSKYTYSVLSVSVSEYTDEFGVLRDSFFFAGPDAYGQGFCT